MTRLTRPRARANDDDDVFEPDRLVTYSTPSRACPTPATNATSSPTAMDRSTGSSLSTSHVAESLACSPYHVPRGIRCAFQSTFEAPETASRQPPTVTRWGASCSERQASDRRERTRRRGSCEEDVPECRSRVSDHLVAVPAEDGAGRDRRDDGPDRATSANAYEQVRRGRGSHWRRSKAAGPSRLRHEHEDEPRQDAGSAPARGRPGTRGLCDVKPFSAKTARFEGGDGGSLPFQETGDAGEAA